MRRVNVTGNAGTGKSTLAGLIAAHLEVPCFGLDQIKWRSGWKQAPQEERTLEEKRLCARPAWVIDGVSRTVREAADTIVFLDYPRRVSFWRCAKRNWRFLFRSRPGLPEGCPEILIIPTLIRLIWRFPSKARPEFLAELDEWRTTKTLVHIRSEADLGDFIHRLARETRDGRQGRRCQ